MKVAPFLAVASALALTAGGCSRSGERRVAAPSPPADPLRVVEAHWVQGAALARAVSFASGSPLVARALSEASDPRLRFAPEYAILAAGATANGLRCAVTLLPYGHSDDPSYATFVALMERDAAVTAQSFDLIVGREPTALEPGFGATELADGRRGWIREHDAAAAGPGGLPGLAPQRFSFVRWGTCFFALAPGWCDAGAKIAHEIAPSVPWATAAGCGAGMAAAAVACVASAYE